MTIRIAMWSGPRNISTAMMRAFGNRADTMVSDEPFYAAYLAATGLDHPMRAETLASQPTDWRAVAAAMAGPVPGPATGGGTIWYQKHMAHHMLPDFGLDWMDACRHAFLIRPPEQVLASYAQKIETPTLADIGVVRQAELYDRVANRTGAAPPVIEGAAIQRDPAGALALLCEALGIAFDPAMLAWPAGRRETDGAWAPVWYGSVERSTGFNPPRDEVTIDALPDRLRGIAEAARPYYDQMARHRLA